MIMIKREHKNKITDRRALRLWHTEVLPLTAVSQQHEALAIQRMNYIQILSSGKHIRSLTL